MAMTALPDRLLALHVRLDEKLGAGFIDDVTPDEMASLTEAAAALSGRVNDGREVVAKLVNRIERGGKTTTFIRPTSLGMDMPLGEYPLYLGPTIPQPGDGVVEYEFEVWQRDGWQAGGSCVDLETARAEANHYASIYSKDGPVTVRFYEKRELPAAPSAKGVERG